MGHLSSHRGQWPMQDFSHGCLFPKTHFFSFLDGLLIVGLKLPWELPQYNLKPVSYVEGMKRQKEKVDHSSLVKDRFYKQENLRKTCLGWQQTSRLLCLPAKSLNSSREARTRFSQIYHPDSLNTAFLFQGCILGEDWGRQGKHTF